MKNNTARNIKIAAVITTAPRYANLAILADGGYAFWHTEAWYSVVVAIAGAGFAIVEVWSAAYIIKSVRNAKSWKLATIWFFWAAILATLAISVGGALYNLIMEVDVKDWAIWLSVPWLVSTAVAPFMIFGGVGLASQQLEQDTDEQAANDIEQRLAIAEQERDTAQTIANELEQSLNATETKLNSTQTELAEAKQVAITANRSAKELEQRVAQLEQLETKYAALERGDKKAKIIWLVTNFPDITQNAAATAVGVAKSTASSWLNGEKSH